MSDEEVTERPDRSMSVAEFCAAESISLTTYYKLKNAGRGPVEERFKGMALVRISAKAREEWHRANEAWSKTKAAKLEDQRRTLLAKVAGELAALSPKHVSKRGKVKTQRRQR